MKKKFILILAVFIIILASGCEKAGSKATSIPDPVQTEEPKTLSGTVYEIDNNTITLITDERKTYTVKSSEDILEAPDGIELAYPITVAYYGKIEAYAEGEKLPFYIRVANFDGLTAEEKAKHLMLTLSIEEAIAQMLIVRCPPEGAAEIQLQYQFGGYILYGDVFKDKTADEITLEISAIKAAAKIPMLIGVDEEGGTVNRISINSRLRPEPFMSPQELYAYGEWEAVVSDTIEKCELLKALGINANFAPVCDISTDTNDFIYGRTFGKGAELTSEYVRKVVEVMNDSGVLCVLKHFPGYGNNEDTHTGIAYDNREYETFVNSDFLPFRAAMAAGAGAVLVCHNIVKSIDGNIPASLSSKVYRILRDDFGFEGVAITDDLYMDAITEFTNEEEAAVLAIEAGNDMLCCKYYEKLHSALKNAVDSGRISRERIDSSIMRILIWKIGQGII